MSEPKKRAPRGSVAAQRPAYLSEAALQAWDYLPTVEIDRQQVIREALVAVALHYGMPVAPKGPPTS